MATPYRESKKSALRDRVVQVEKPESRARKSGSGGRLHPRILILIGIIFLALIVAIFIFSRRELHSASKGWTLDYNVSGVALSDFEQYYPYADGMLRVTRDGATYISSGGKTIWNQAYEMVNPYVSINGSYVAIADQEQRSIYIMDTSGSVGRSETSLPITKVAVSRQGVVYAVLDDNDASYITVFRKDGSALDITIKSIIAGDGYPQDIAVSPDGTELLVAYSYIENGIIKNKAIFYNLSDVGQSMGGNRVVGGFTDDFTGQFIGRVNFSSDSEAQAYYDGGIACFSTQMLTSPELSQKIEISEDIRSIAYDEDYMAVITEAVSEEGKELEDPYRLTVYKTSGTKVYERLFSFQYTGFLLEDGRAILYRNERLEIYGRDGRLRFSGSLEGTISAVKIVADNILGMTVLASEDASMSSYKLR